MLCYVSKLVLHRTTILSLHVYMYIVETATHLYYFINAYLDGVMKSLKSCRYILLHIDLVGIFIIHYYTLIDPYTLQCRYSMVRSMTNHEN